MIVIRSSCCCWHSTGTSSGTGALPDSPCFISSPVFHCVFTEWALSVPPCRPTQPAHFWPDEPCLLAGRDALRKGTWLGVTKHGRFALITNYREVGGQHAVVTRAPVGPGRRLAQQQRVHRGAKCCHVGASDCLTSLLSRCMCNSFGSAGRLYHVGMLCMRLST